MSETKRRCNMSDKPTFGLETEFGPVIVRVVSATRLYVEAGRYDEGLTYGGKAHLNDDRPALTYRGHDYIGSVGVQVTDSSKLSYANANASLNRRAGFVDATPTAKAKIAQAILNALATYVEVDEAGFKLKLAQAEVIDAKWVLDYATKDKVEAQAKFVEAETKVNEERAKHAKAIAALNALTFAQASA